MVDGSLILRFFSITSAFYNGSSFTSYISRASLELFCRIWGLVVSSELLCLSTKKLTVAAEPKMCKFEQTTWACGHQTHFRCSPCHHARTWPTCESVKTLYRVLENKSFECPKCQNVRKVPTDLFQQRNYSIEVSDPPNPERWAAFWEAMRREYGSPQQIQSRQQWQQQLEQYQLQQQSYHQQPSHR